MNPEQEPRNAQWETMLTDEQKKLMGEQKINLGSQLHDEWREGRKKPDGTYEPRVKVLVETAEGKEKWFNDDQIPEGATELKRQDIANTDYEKLDPHWQEDNKTSAGVALDLIYEAKTNNEELDNDFIEEASSKIHDAWMERTTGAPDEQKKPYTELSEKEKERDRAIINKAIQIFSENKPENTELSRASEDHVLAFLEVSDMRVFIERLGMYPTKEFDSRNIHTVEDLLLCVDENDKEKLNKAIRITSELIEEGEKNPDSILPDDPDLKYKDILDYQTDLGRALFSRIVRKRL